MAMKSEIEAALKAHSLWRERFNDILHGRAPFDLGMISATDQCDFGKWLSSEGKRLLSPEAHKEVCAVHQEFHQIAAGIIKNIKDKHFAEAKNAIELKGPLNQTSLRLKSLLTKLSFMEPAAAAVQPEENAPPTAEPKT